MRGFAKTLTAAVAVLAAASALAACGGSDETSTVTETVSTSTTTPTEATTTTTESTSEDGTSQPDQTVTKLTGFTSPTGNIGCYIDQKSVRCDIGDRDWEPPKAPSSCNLDYGQGIELRAGGAADFVCAGDTALGGGDVLDYGTSIGAGLLICESEESGMTCRDTETGRGFTLSKQSYKIF
ncbi:MAG: DUF6636 domain-containing protein [Solirubrobacterales bacterium]